MAVLTGNIKPITVSRVNAARIKQFRLGFTPKDTTSTGVYTWKSVEGPYNLDDVSAAATWTNIES